MSFNIERGLFKFDFIDHHAVLGISVNADTKEVRKRYLKIARTLHPDSSKAESETEKKLANQLLSKLVNPAYEQLSRSNNRDYLVSLSHLGRRLAAEQGKLPISSDAAKQLTKAGPNLDNLYKTLVQNLASNQYESVDQVLNKIAEISEVNMVYLMLKGSKGEAIQGGGVKAPTATATGTGKSATGTATGRTPTGAGAAGGKTSTGAASGSFGGMSGTNTGNSLNDSGVSRVAEYIRRAEGYMSKNNFAAAVLELREALKLDQHNSRCHTLLGVSYLKQNQVTMAKVHINKALQLNPKEELALKSQRYLEGLAQKGGAKPKVQPQSEPRKQPDKSGGGGLFGGLFGGKKK
jgi:curved DNA-binding protein CbpA